MLQSKKKVSISRLQAVLLKISSARYWLKNTVDIAEVAWPEQIYDDLSGGELQVQGYDDDNGDFDEGEAQ
jgi:hypothetical protein